MHSPLAFHGTDARDSKGSRRTAVAPAQVRTDIKAWGNDSWDIDAWGNDAWDIDAWDIEAWQARTLPRVARSASTVVPADLAKARRPLVGNVACAALPEWHGACDSTGPSSPLEAP